MLTIPQLKKVQTDDPYLYEALKKIVGAVNALGTHIGADPAGTVPPPAAIASVQVTAANGFFNVAIVDNSTVTRGINYFLEYDVSPAFPNPWVYDLGASRNVQLALGNQTLYFRAYSQYLGGPPGPSVAYGSPPLAVVGGGAAAPTPLPSQGSGTGGGGFGADPDSSLRVSGRERFVNTL